MIRQTDTTIWAGSRTLGRLRHCQSHCCRHRLVGSGHETGEGWLTIAGERFRCFQRFVGMTTDDSREKGGNGNRVRLLQEFASYIFLSQVSGFVNTVCCALGKTLAATIISPWLILTFNPAVTVVWIFYRHDAE